MKFLYLLFWQIRAFLGRRAPLQSVIFLLDKCNLRCRHCSVYALSNPRIKTLAQIRTELQYCYDLGSRFVDFEGGELYLWRDNTDGIHTYAINDIIDLAHSIGFWSVTITTNAQLPFTGTHADQVWVSMDGVGEWHDAIRGKGTFARLEQHIAQYAQSPAPKDRRKAPVCVNMVINNQNYHCLKSDRSHVVL